MDGRTDRSRVQRQHGLHGDRRIRVGAIGVPVSTEGGTINGWNPAVPAPSPSTQSFVVADRTGEDANYKGLAIASTPDGNMLYATDFHNARVDMFEARSTS